MNVMMNQNAGTSEEFRYVYGTKSANIFVSGELDGATVFMEAESPSGDWIKVRGSEITEPIMVVMECYPIKSRFKIENEGAATLVTIDLIGQVVK